MEIASPADFFGLFLGSARSLPAYRGTPENILAFGRYKVRPTTRKQPDVMPLWLARKAGERKMLIPARVPPASPATATTSRQVRRYLTREFDKDRRPLSNNLVQVLRARQMAERNEARLTKRAGAL